MSNFDFRADIAINPAQLDVEWLRQATLYFKYAEAAAEARDDRDRAKDAIEVVRSELASKIRTNPQDYGFVGDKKPTEGAIESTVLLQSEYKDAMEIFFKARRRSDLIQSAVTSLEMKKSALENMVRLLNSGYIAVPLAPRDVNQEWTNYLQSSKEETQAQTSGKFEERRRRRSSE